MTDERKRPGATFWVSVLLVTALLLAPVTFGPAVWLTSRGYLEPRTVERVYKPVLFGLAYLPQPFWPAVNWWAGLGIPEGSRIVFLSVETDHIVAVFHF